ncbi:ankyrin repeat protein, putative [Trichomonas vaginalis G3]|uniref:Ankyrin repeat protein, putative n=1 Tax=Trichomonas vaginalis (strain ATCC PRA-98 / G3) TaxID=412133 RepID=A2DAL6_TRIV3|nr:protein ubiquitination [Trichomonas vaginalis G3]EAY22519.1 ankyrin repeat protein, putative [Trichomonas vaginalis G3]KAI5497252.1 protein ubiquitination [Trichomonas vaginalis G3]|eukprot:XP_001583505.1 ankyrin repeat protein [Trichomonas vaginalis G3]
MKLITFVQNDDLCLFNLMSVHPVNQFVTCKEKNLLPTERISIIHAAAYYDAINIFIYLDREMNMSIQNKTDQNYTPLHYACANNSIEVATYILIKNPQLAVQNFRAKYDLLYLAINSRSEYLVKLLLECKFQPKLGDWMNSHFIFASKKGCINILNLLLQYSSDRNAGEKIINYAIRFQRTYIVDALIKSGYRVDSMTQGKLPLHEALSSPVVNLDIIKLIVNNSYYFDTNEKSSLSTVHYICKSMNSKAAKMILRQDVDVNRLDFDGNPGPFY